MMTNHTFLRSSLEINLLAQFNLEFLDGPIGEVLFTIGKALLILVLGLIIINVVKGLIKKGLDKTDIDNKIAGWITGESESSFPVEEWISEIVGWILTLFVVLAFLDVLKLEVVSQPLNAFLQEITEFLPRIGGAALLLVLAWGLGTIIKMIVINAFKRFGIDERLNEQIQDEEEETTGSNENISLGETIGNALYWLIFLLFLPSVLSVLQLEGTLRPLEELVDEILGIVPNILAAILIGAVGWVVAQIIKKVVTNLLKATGINQIGAKFGLGTNKKGQSLAQIIGSVAYVLVLIPIAITALDALQIQAISVPATDMLNQVLDILPKLFSALVILGLAYVAGQYLSELVTNLLTSIGFNNVTQWLGLAQTQTGETESESSETDLEASESDNNIQTPAQIVGIIVLVAVMLVASLTAVDILGIDALRGVVSFILLLSGQVLAGMLVFAVGLYFSNLVFNLISNSGTRQANFLAQTARIAILVLVSAMALERIGIAPNIVNLAFGLLTAGIAVAIALAFGLGGREAAGKALEEWLENLKD